MFKTYIDLKTSLSKLGVKMACTDVANFSRIHDTIPLKIDQIKQTTFVTVDERATLTAAET